MAYTTFKNGFTITSAAAVDRRIVLSKAEMLTAEDVYNLPDVYFALCTDDGKMYMYNVNNTPNTVTGKYKLIDELIQFDAPQVQEHLEEAIEKSETITNLNTSVVTLEEDMDDIKPQVEESAQNITEIQTWITNVKLDGGLVEPEE